MPDPFSTTAQTLLLKDTPRFSRVVQLLEPSCGERLDAEFGARGLNEPPFTKPCDVAVGKSGRPTDGLLRLGVDARNTTEDARAILSGCYDVEHGVHSLQLKGVGFRKELFVCQP